jgi:ABC-type phosphate transport system substrate-binding protein
MRYLLLTFSFALLIACNSKDSASSTNEASETEQTDTTQTLQNENSGDQENTSIDGSTQKKLGKKYQNLVDNNILTLSEASKYRSIEQKYKEIRINFQNQGSWSGTSAVAKANRASWIREKNNELDYELGIEKNQALQEFLKRK